MKYAGGNLRASVDTRRHKRECMTCKLFQKIREAAERNNNIVPEMVMLYKETDSIGDLLGKVISL